MYEVIIIGAGTTGAAAAYHLAQYGVRDILVLDMGTPGNGSSATGSSVAVTSPTKEHAAAPTLPGPTIHEEETHYIPENSGSAVFGGGDAGPAAIKMIVTLPPYLALEGFAQHHGWEGVATYMDMSRRGLEMELDLAAKVLPCPTEQVKQLGSLMVCESHDVCRLRNEYQHLQRLGTVDCEWWDEEQVSSAHGIAANFKAGIWFPSEARIDSVAYARGLLRAASKMGGAVVVEENCAPMASVTTTTSTAGKSHAKVQLADGRILHAKYAIVATGGMHIDEHLSGLLTPRFSYLVGLPHPPPPPPHDAGEGATTTTSSSSGRMSSPDSPNFYTFGFSHDWCVESNFVRISGEDHFSGLKAPRATQRNRTLAQWGYTKYPYLDPKAPYPERYGIYSETADFVPLVGMPRGSDKVCYMVGCNAWGQASLSAVASMAPALLGYRDFRPEEVNGAKLCSIRRFVGRDVIESARRASHRALANETPTRRSRL